MHRYVQLCKLPVYLCMHGYALIRAYAYKYIHMYTFTIHTVHANIDHYNKPIMVNEPLYK